MTYQTGTTTDIDDLIDTVLKTFMTDEGWTLNDDNWPDHLHLSKDQCFISMRRDPTTGDNNFNDIYSVARRDTKLIAHLGSAYSGAGGTPTARFISQPDSLVDDTGDTMLEVNAIDGATVSYHLFSGGPGIAYVYLVVEHYAGNFSHFWLGNLDKDTLSYSSGGGFASGQYCYWWPHTLTYGNRNDVKFDDTDHHWGFGESHNQHVYSGDTSPEPMRSNSIRPIWVASNAESSYFGSASSYGRWGDSLIASHPNPLNGVTPFVPMPVAIDYSTDSEATAYIGSLPNIRMCNMKGRFAGEVITIGSDNWVVFPIRHANFDYHINEENLVASPELNTTSGYFGCAIKKIV